MNSFLTSRTSKRIFALVALFVLLDIFFYHLSLLDSLRVLWWYLALCLPGVFLFFISGKIFNTFPDKAWGLLRPLGVLLWIYLVWILNRCGIPDQWFLPLGVLFLMGVFTFASKKKEMLPSADNLLRFETLSFLVFLGFLAQASLHPDIAGGEKPMDASLLFNFARNLFLPPTDVWAPGQPLGYYYMGYYLYANLIKITGIAFDTGYLLSLASIAVQLVSAAWSFLFWVTKRRSIATFGPVGLLLFVNFEAIRRLYLNGFRTDFSFFWDQTRFFQNNLFSEYPGWSLIFADLHPHVMAYPYALSLMVLFLLFAGVKTFSLKSHSLRMLSFMIAFVWGAFLPLNVWDFVIYGLVFAFVLTIKDKESNKKNFLLVRIVLPLLICLMAFILYAPALSILRGGPPTKEFLFANWHNPLSSYLKAYAHWFFILLFVIGIPLLGHRKFSWRELRAIPTIVVAIPLMIGLVSMIFFTPLWPLLLIGSVLLLILVWFHQRRRSLSSLALLLFGGAAIFLMCLAEHVTVVDRINTLFKFNNEVALMLTCAVLVSIAIAFTVTPRRLGLWMGWFATVLCCLLALLWVCNLSALIGIRKDVKQGAHLEGLKFMHSIHPQDAALAKWMNENIHGTPVILEATSSESYGYSARFSTMTGLPCYLGWPWHVQIRGVPRQEVTRRLQKIASFYESSDALSVHSDMFNEGIEYVVVGEMERQTSRKEALDKFASFPELFGKIFENGQTALFWVR